MFKITIGFMILVVIILVLCEMLSEKWAVKRVSSITGLQKIKTFNTKEEAFEYGCKIQEKYPDDEVIVYNV